MAKSRLEQYLVGIDTGEITACVKMKKLAKRLLKDLRAKRGKWRFDQDKAERAVTFIESFCKIPTGRLGAPFMLEPWEYAFVETIFGFVDAAGVRKYQEALCIIGRKNGKTSLCAAIELYMLIADGEGAPQIYNLATKVEQAELAYNACVRMVRQSKKLGKYAIKRAEDMYCPDNFGYIKPMTSRTTSLDGLDVHMAVIDELAAVRDRDLYDLVKQGMSAREQPLLLEITTNGFVRNGIFDAQYEYASKWLDGKIKDDHFVAFIYELDDPIKEWDDESCWIKANPAIGTVKKWDTLRGYVQKAKDDPTFKPTVMTKDFNVPENAAVAWLSFQEATNKETYDLDAMGFRYCVAGFDASDTVDLSAACALMMRPGDEKIYATAMYWLPQDVIDAYSDAGDRKGRDSVPYETWIARGLLRTVPGNKVDKRVFLDWLVELKEQHDIWTFAVGFDPWHMDDSTLRDLGSLVGEERCNKVRQGPMTLSQPMKQLKAEYGANRVVDNHNPVTEWCRMNLQVKRDVNDNIQPVKKMNDPRNRIDGFMAELDAYVVLCNLMDDYLQVC